MSSRLTALSAGALVAVMLLAVAAPAHAKPVSQFKPDETKATLVYSISVVGG